MNGQVVGVDGCPGGWIAVIWGETISHRFFPSFRGILDTEAAVIAVDMPIGLPNMSGRDAERLARANLGSRRSSVFTIPSRAAVMSETYAEACAINVQFSNPPRKIAKQTFHLFPKIREIDVLITPALQSRVYEVHPEAAFWVMNGKQPVALAKKAKSQNHKPGLSLRRELLRSAGFPIQRLPNATYRKSDVGDDDLIDACACAWTARRIFEGKALSFPEHPARDDRGLVMCIKA
jgi:predicted RNase H-like nuclease